MCVIVRCGAFLLLFGHCCVVCLFEMVFLWFGCMSYVFNWKVCCWLG